jgi:hypothetical protein
MAGWRRSDTKADQSSTKTTDTRLKGTRRKLSLVLITIVLNVLLWSALICIAASLYQIISDPFNTSSYAQVTLTIISVCELVFCGASVHRLRCIGPGDNWIYFLSYNFIIQAEAMGATTAIFVRHEEELFCSYPHSRLFVCTLVTDFRMEHDTGCKHTNLFAKGGWAPELGVRPDLQD